MKTLILVAVCLAGCSTAPPCPPLPTMAPGQQLQEYTLEVIHLYHECRGD